MEGNTHFNASINHSNAIKSPYTPNASISTIAPATSNGQFDPSAPNTSPPLASVLNSEQDSENNVNFFTNPNVYTLTEINLTQVDQNQIPRPFNIHCQPLYLDENQRVYNSTDVVGPLRDFDSSYVVDNGISSPRFIRTTLYQIPRNPDSLSNTHVRFGIIVQPFAKSPPGQEVPLIDFNRFYGYYDSSKDFMIRCEKCGCYINSFVLNRAPYTEAACNLCETPFSLSDKNNQILNTLSNDATLDRPILRGSIDFLAPLSFYPQEQPKPKPSLDPLGDSNSHYYSLSHYPAHVIIIDCTKKSNSLNMKTTVVEGIKYALGLEINNLINSKICILTFTNNIQFYTYDDNPQNVLIVSEEDPFIPCRISSIFIPIEKILEDGVDKFFESVLSFKPTDDTTVNTGVAAIQMGIDLIRRVSVCGTITVFHAGLPDLIDDKGENSPDNELYNIYNGLVLQCYEANIGIDSFFCLPQETMPNFTINTYLSLQTGGYFKIFSKFDYKRDYFTLYNEIYQSLTAECGYGCELRLRTDKRIVVKEILTPHTSTRALVDKSAIKVPKITPFSSIAFLLDTKHIADDINDVSFQAACLHLNTAGKACVRVHNFKVGLTRFFQHVYKHADYEALANIYMRILAYNRLRFKKTIRLEIFSELVAIFGSYRLYCSSSTTANVLILPVSLKRLPLLAMAAFKLISLYNDQRLTHIANILAKSVTWGVGISKYIYPRLYSLGREHDFRQNTLNFKVIPTSGEYVYSDGIYLLDNGFDILMYFGLHVPLSILKDVFSSEYSNEDWFDTVITKKFNNHTIWLNIELSDSELAEQIKERIERIAQNPDMVYKPLRVIAPRTRGEEIFKTYLVEDQMEREPSYLAFLSNIHNRIYSKMEALC